MVEVRTILPLLPILVCSTNSFKIGPYKLEVQELWNHDNVNPERVKSFFYLQQLSMNERVIRGDINVSEPTGPLMVNFHRVLLSDSGSSLMIRNAAGSACRTAAAVNEMISHISGFNETTCGLNAGRHELRDVDYDAVYHRDNNVFAYVRMKHSFTFTNDYAEPLFGFTILCEAAKLYAIQY